MAEFPLLSLDDNVIELIIDKTSNRVRRQLRCVNRRLRDMVDERLTVMDLRTGGSNFGVCFRALKKRKRFPNVHKVFLGWVDRGTFKKLLTAEWPHLAEVDFPLGEIDLRRSVDDHTENGGLVLESVRRVQMDADEDVGLCTLQALCEIFPSLDSLSIHGNIDYIEEQKFYGPYDFEGREGLRSEKLGALPLLRRVALSACMFALHFLYEGFSIDWHNLEELDLAGSPPHCVSMFFKRTARGASWPNLKCLILNGCIRSVEDLEAVFDADMPKIEVADLSAVCYEGLAAGAVLRRCACAWPNLKELAIEGALKDPNELATFMEVVLPNLESIYAVFTPELIAVVAANAHSWPAIKSLERFFDPSVDDLVNLFRDNPWPLEYIDIAARFDVLTFLGAMPEAALLRSSLRKLDFLCYSNKDANFSVQTSAQPWAALEELNFESHAVEMSPAEAAALSAANQLGRLPNLRKIKLRVPEHGAGSSLAALCASPFAELEELELGCRTLKNGGGDVLAQFVGAFPKLSSLSIPSISTSQLEHLLNAPWPESLEKINLETRWAEDSISAEQWSQIDAPRWEAVIAGFMPRRVAYLRPKY